MEIEKIAKMKTGKYKIFFKNKESFITYDDVILKENLLYKKKLDLLTYKKITNETAYYDVYHKIIKMIGTKYRSLKEIEQYLEKTDLPLNEQKKMLSTLIQNGFIDDKRFTDCYLNDRIYLSNDGPIQIYKSLLSYGIDEEMIQDAFQKIDDDVFKDKLEKQMQKKISMNTKYSKHILKQKMMMYFKEKGFEAVHIEKVFHQVYKENNQILSKEFQKISKKLSMKYEGDILTFKIKQKLYSKGFTKEEINSFFEN